MNIQVERVKNKFEELFGDKIDMSDCTADNTSDDYINKKNSRMLAAYALMLKSNADEVAAAAAITDGMKDAGIDAIYNDEQGKELILVQAKWSNDGNGTISQGDTLKFVNGVNKLINFEFENVNAKILNKQREIEKAIKDMDYKIKLILIFTSNSEISDESADALLKLENSTNDEVSELLYHEIIHLNDIYENLAKKASSDEITIDDVMLKNWGPICETDEKIRGYYGTINAGQIAGWWQEYGNDLLDKNIRFFKGSTDVNAGMKQMLITQPEKFQYYNNGIKVIAKKATRKLAYSTDRDTGLFTLEGLSIVNGAQTTGCIGETFVTDKAQVNKANVMIQIISLENTEPKFGSTVTKLSNTQNRIENKDFVSMDPYQENLRMDLMMDDITYSYKDGNRSESQADNYCTLDEVAVAIGCGLDDISIVAQIKRAYGSVFDDITKSPYKTIFNPSHNNYEIWNSIEVYRIFEQYNNTYQKEHSGLERLVSIHANRYLLHLVLLSFKKKYTQYNKMYIDMNEEIKREIKDWLEKYIDDIVIIKNADFTDAYPAYIFKNASRCKAIEEKITIY